LTTTVAQLNFIRWCITNGVIDQCMITKTADSQTPPETLKQCNHNKTNSNCNSIEAVKHI
jgi:hypothetical protein